MHYTILLYAPEPTIGEGEGEVPPEVIERAKEGYRTFAAELAESGAFVAGEVFDAEDTAVCVAERDGATQLTVGPPQRVTEALAAVFVVDVDSRDAAVAWAKRCPGVSYGTLEVRAAATSITPSGGWS